MHLLLILPLLVPLFTAVLALLARRRRSQRLVSLAGATALFATSLALLATVWTDGVQAMQGGNWPAPFGITLVADLFGAMMVVLAALMGLAVIVCSLATIDEARERHAYHPLPRPADGRLRRLPDGRPLQPLRLVRGAAHLVVRADGARRRTRAAEGRSSASR